MDELFAHVKNTYRHAVDFRPAYTKPNRVEPSPEMIGWTFNDNTSVWRNWYWVTLAGTVSPSGHRTRGAATRVLQQIAGSEGDR